MTKRPLFFRWTNIIGLITCFGLMCLVAVRRDGTLFGSAVGPETEAAQASTGATPRSTGATPHIDAVADTVINTSALSVGTIGYKGPVPVAVTLSGGKVMKVEAMPNNETPGFFKKVTDSGLLESWNGKTPREALKLHVDAVSGATYSSKALIANVTAALESVAAAEEETAMAGDAADDSGSKPSPSWQWLAALIVVSIGIVLPLVLHNKWYRRVQLVLNVAVLGFLTGSFLSYSLIINILSQGIADWILAFVALLMLAAAFVMPLFGRTNHYCMWICPLGSAQELMGKVVNHKPHLGAKTVKILTRLRDILWYTLMVAMWFGAWFDWMDYEVFACFRFWEASAAVIATGAVILVISIVVDRPFCRFVCPTGKLFRESERLG